MIPYEVDPSLHSEKPHEPKLDDGFDSAHVQPAAADDEPPEAAIPDKSDF
jgi:hypothetical protein